MSDNAQTRCVLKTAHQGPCLFVLGIDTLPWWYCGKVKAVECHNADYYWHQLDGYCANCHVAAALAAPKP